MFKSKFHTFTRYPYTDVCASYQLSPESMMTQLGRNAAAVYQVHDVDELKLHLIDVWHGF